MSQSDPQESRTYIDADKIAENPGLLPYAHHVGSAIIAPIDKGRTRGLAMSAMYEQTSTQLHQLREQVELLLQQAQKIHDRIEVSESIYTAEISFKPNILQIYHLYERPEGQRVVSMIGPDEWRKNPPYTFIASVRLLSDHTWEVLDMEEKISA